MVQVRLRTFFGRPGQWFEENDLDGDKNSIFHDVDGSVTGYRDTYVGRADNFLIQHPGCVNVSQWSGVICSGRYSQVQRPLQAWSWAVAPPQPLWHRPHSAAPPTGVRPDPGSPQPQPVHQQRRVPRCSPGAEGHQQPGGAVSAVPARPDDEQELHPALERPGAQRGGPLAHQL